MEFKSSNRSYLMDTWNEVKEIKKSHQKIFEIRFAWGEFGNLPQLLDRLTGALVPNSRKPNQAEVHFAHFVLRISGEKISILSEHFAGVAISTFKLILKHFLDLYYKSIDRENPYIIRIEGVGAEDFFERIEEMQKVSEFTLWIDRESLSNDPLDELSTLMGSRTLKKKIQVKYFAVDRFTNLKQPVEKMVKNMLKKNRLTKISLSGLHKNGKHKSFNNLNLLKQLEITAKIDPKTYSIESASFFELIHKLA